MGNWTPKGSGQIGISANLANSTAQMPKIELPKVGDTILLEVFPYGGTQVVSEENLSSGADIVVLEVKELKKTKVVFE